MFYTALMCGHMSLRESILGGASARDNLYTLVDFAAQQVVTDIFSGWLADSMLDKGALPTLRDVDIWECARFGTWCIGLVFYFPSKSNADSMRHSVRH